MAKPSKVAAVENGRRSSSVTTAVVTMRTIAGIAGVSAMTVSRALKAESLVSKATRDRVTPQPADLVARRRGQFCR